MYTNKARMTGLSGIDTQSMIDNLMKAESAKLYKYQKSTQLLDWKQTAYRAQAKNITNFKSDFLIYGGTGINLRSKNAFTNFSSTIKNSAGVESNAVQVTSSSGVKTGNIKVEVSQIAQKAIEVSGEIQGNIKSADNIDLRSLKDGDNFNIVLDGVSKNIKITSADIAYIGQDSAKFASTISAKLKTAFGMENDVQKVDVKSKSDTPADLLAGIGKLEFTTIKGHEISIKEGTGRDTTVKATDTIGTAAADDNLTFRVGLPAGLDDELKTVTVKIKEGDTAEKYVAAVNAGLKEQGITNLTATLKDGKIAFQNLNSDTPVEITGGATALDKLGFGAGITNLTVKHTNVLADLRIKHNTKDSVDMSKTIKEVLGKTGALAFDINGVNFTLDADTDTVATLMDKVNKSAAGVTMSFDAINRQFKIEGKSTGVANNITGTFATALGFTNKQEAKDALLKVDGVSTSRDSNNVEINGLQLQLNSVTSGELNINVSNDTAKTMDNIKKFVEGYNKMIESISTELKTNVAKKKWC